MRHRQRLTRDVIERATRDRDAFIAIMPTCGEKPRRPRANPWLVGIVDGQLDQARTDALGPHPGWRREVAR